MEFETVISEFLQSRRAKSRRESTIIWYSECLHQFTEWLKTQHLVGDWLRPSLIEFYIAHRIFLSSPATGGNHFRALRAFFNWLEERHKIPSPMHGLTEPKADRKEPRYATHEQFRELQASIKGEDWIDYRDRLMVNLLFLCALRVGEVITIRITSFDLHLGVLRVEDGKTGAAPVPLLPEVSKSFLEYAKVRPDPGFETDNDLICLAGDGYRGVRGTLSVNGVRTRLRKLCQNAGVKYLNPHSFRHGLAMYLLNRKGADMAIIQRLLRHDRLSTTSEIYARWQTKGILDAYKGLMKED